MTEKRGKRKNKSFLIKWLEKVLPAAFKVFLLSFLLGIISLIYSSSAYGHRQLEYMEAYFSNPRIIGLNILPIFISIATIYILFNNLALGFILTSIVFMGLVIINSHRFSYSTKPMDLGLFKNLGDRLEILKSFEYIDKAFIALVLLIAIISLLLLHRREKYKITRKSKLACLALLVILALSNLSYYRSPIKYDKLKTPKDLRLISKRDDYMAKGFIYSSLHDFLKIDNRLGCKEESDKILSDFEREEEKLDLDFIILELDAYGDFSEYNGIDPSIYEGFNLFAKEGIRGDLIPANFGGGSIDTEKSFITGFQEGMDRKGSYFEFLKKQAYNLDLIYTGKASDYQRSKNRRKYNFTDFKTYNNKLSNRALGNSILERYESRDKSKGYLSLTISEAFTDHCFKDLAGEQYIYIENPVSPKDYRRLNNYFAKIKEIDQSLKTLYSSLDQAERPIVLILYSSYSPGIGIVNDGDQLDDIFDNYKTPYVIWGNKTLKDSYNKNFDREGINLGPEFLFPYVLDYLDIHGDSFIAYMNNLREYFTVNQYRYLKLGEDFIHKDRLPTYVDEKYREYKTIQNCLN